MQNYKFTWSDLGDIGEGRPNLGPKTTVAVYRLMQFTMRASLEKNYGLDKTQELFVEAGRLAGTEFCKNVLDIKLPLKEFIADLHDKLVELSVGVLKMEYSDTEKMSFVMTVSEDLDCSGLPIKGNTVCDYDEGFIEGIFNVYTGKQFSVKEVDCWSTGDRTCRFIIDLKK
ncbi:MAG: 4-vinyl reductase [Bacteroidales bacterium]|nr:4-vinyl reductase [Bacteroidales bacterium]MCF8402388.1 4-vinyl reductase [Bacteroidales bacterium]